MKLYRRKLSGEDAETSTIPITKDLSKGAIAEIEIRDDGAHSIRNG